MTNFRELFPVKKPVIGMIHLAGGNPREIIQRAQSEIELYQNEGLSGAIIENCHTKDYAIFVGVIERFAHLGRDSFRIGLNLLGNDAEGVRLAVRNNLAFVWQDAVAGTYTGVGANYCELGRLRRENPQLGVLGGVWPRYYTPVENSNLEDDLRAGMNRADAIVVTGKGTGIETPLEKIRLFRQYAGEFPIVVGAGLNFRNAYEQLLIADGAIVGSSLKLCNRSELPVDKMRTRVLMEIIGKIRREIQA